MKAIVLFSVAAFVVVRFAVANAQPADQCASLVNNVNNGAATINQNATAYWAHRANFVDLIYGPSSQVVPNAMQVAQQEKSQADAIKAGMPGTVASFKSAVAAAQNGNAQGQNNNGQGQNNNGQGQNNNGQGCLTPAQQSNVVEPSIKNGKRVNFDQFPDELPESVVGSGPRRMPQ